MKILEINRRVPHLYLDMDGVQADFFGAWSKELGVNHWKAIKDKEQEIEKLSNSNRDTVYNFFYNLEPLSGGSLVVDFLNENNIAYSVLTAPLRGPYRQASIEAKRDWLKKYNPGAADSVIFESNKWIYAKSEHGPNVLVDDFGKYLKDWAKHGGIAVKHEDQYEDPDTGYNTIQRLKQIYMVR